MANPLVVECEFSHSALGAGSTTLLNGDKPHASDASNCALRQGSRQTPTRHHPDAERLSGRLRRLRHQLSQRGFDRRPHRAQDRGASRAQDLDGLVRRHPRARDSDCPPTSHRTDFWRAEGDDRLHGFRADTGAPVFAGGGLAESMQGLRHFVTILASDDRLFVVGDGRIFAFRP